MLMVTLHIQKSIPNDWCNVIVVFQALGKQPGLHRPELHRRRINSETIIDLNNYITSNAINSEKSNVMQCNNYRSNGI